MDKKCHLALPIYMNPRGPWHWRISLSVNDTSTRFRSRNGIVSPSRRQDSSIKSKTFSACPSTDFSPITVFVFWMFIQWMAEMEKSECVCITLFASNMVYQSDQSCNKFVSSLTFVLLQSTFAWGALCLIACHPAFRHEYFGLFHGITSSKRLVGW